MRFLLCAALMWTGCGGERPPLRPVDAGEETDFAHDTFAAAGLERAVRRALAQPQGPLDDAALGGLQYLEATDRAIADLRGIERLRGLETLMLGGNEVADIEPLRSLLRLRVLDLADNRLSDLSPLSGLLLLSALNLDGNRVSDLGPLRRLTLLRLLNLDGNQVRDIAVLGGLRRLQSVELSGNPLEIDQIAALREQGLEVTFYQPTVT
ncbi:MAG: leucine-rich repeat domain-containing protein, partial [Candidatus Latescibacteria bacterium]|nr:leucine-rich repeat domain-containing protein [Candidatus Latescibacterota bacterium]